MPSPKGKNKSHQNKRGRDEIDEMDLSDPESTHSSFSKTEIQQLINKAIEAAMVTFMASNKIQLDLAIAPLTEMNNKIVALESKITLLEGKLSTLESGKTTPDRHKSIIISGLPEPAKETPAQLTATIIEMTKTMMIDNFDMDDAFRVGKSNPTKGPRPVILKLLRSRDKWQIFSNKKNLYMKDGKVDKSGKFASIFINEDMTAEERKVAADLRGKLRDIKSKDPTVTGVIRRDTLTTRKDGKILQRFKWSQAGINILP
ncbi:hypothetical protein Fcan01_27498 [Folsomia candida]|uniref:Uncharacterized protein n=1 Tax=Folsomia candida TaxID=158441 RepID=A0A226CXJ9_FOLCA|nr:hypothetical protein Fcan01_27498 [Folsomia candida]